MYLCSKTNTRMNQLQLYISKAGRSYRRLTEINPTEDVRRRLRDFSPALAALSYDPDEKHIIYALSYIDEGILLRIIRTIPPQAPHHLDATLFIANGLDISADELDEVVGHISQMVLASQITEDDMDSLHRLMARTYGYDSDAPAILPSALHPASPAALQYGGDSDLTRADLWVDPYQPDWTAYSAVIITSADDKITCKCPEAPQPLATYTLLPPKKSKDGFTPHIFRRPFDRPFRVTANQSIDIVWKMSGFEDIVEHISVTHDHMRCPTPETNVSHKSISPAFFLITSRENDEPLLDCHITVNDIEIDRARSFSERELASARVRVEHPDHMTFDSRLDLASPAQVNIKLQKHNLRYCFSLPMQTPEGRGKVEFEILTSSEIKASPIEGYIATGHISEGDAHVNPLRRSDTGAWLNNRRQWIFALAGLAVGIILSACVMMLFGDSEPAPAANTETIVTDSAGNVETRVSSVSADAIAYLDNARIWDRSKMEAIAGLEGLFDQLNNYEFSAIIKRADSLAKSKNFAKVAAAARNAVDKKKDPRRSAEEHNPAYNKPGDEKITWLAYTYWIDP